LLSRRRRVFVWMGPLLVLSWLSIAFLDPDPPVRGVIALGYFLGSLFAHATLAAAWAALGPGRFAWRFPLSMAWAISLPLAVGINVGLNGGPGDAVVVVGGSLLGQWLALQAPLWALALGFGWQLRHSGDVEEVANGSQIRFGIRHLLLVMLIVGVVLGIGRIVVSNVRLSGTRETLIFMFLAVAAIVMTLPLLLSALMRRMAALGVVLAILFVVVVSAFELPLLSLLGGAGPGKRDFLAINTAMAAVILVSASVVRLNGYCLYARARASVP
jgi:hypothetical protein